MGSTAADGTQVVDLRELAGIIQGQADMPGLSDLATNKTIAKIIEAAEKIVGSVEKFHELMKTTDVLKKYQVSNTDASLNVNNTYSSFVYVRDDDFGIGEDREKKGSVQHGAYTGDSVVCLVLK